MKDVAEMMTPHPITLHSSMSVPEIMNIFIDNGITSAPVLDNFGHIAGMMTELTLITIYFRINAKPELRDQLAYHLDALEKAEVLEDKATPGEVFKALIRSSTHRVLIIDRQQKIVGIVSPKDILRALSGGKDRLTRAQRDLKDARDHLRSITGQLRDAEDIIKRYQSYLENAPFLIHSVNDEGRIIMANRKLCEALGYNPGGMIGLMLEDLYTDEHAAKAREGLKKLISDGWTSPAITVMKCRDKSTLRVETTSSVLKTEDGKFIGTITMSRRLGSDNMLRALHGVLDPDKDEAF